MQTSKSHSELSNNVHIKLELDDLEYIFADGQNLVIKPNTDDQEVDENNIIYTDGEQAVVLPNGVKHVIQTVGGETYFVGNDNENIEQLVINEEDTIQENDAVEYVEDTNDVDDDDNEENEPEPKRFKIGDVEYVTINNQTVLINEDSQFSVIEEENLPESENYQYAILKDGKLHLQLCESDSFQVLDENTETPTEESQIAVQDEDSIDRDKIQEYVLINTEVPSEDNLDITKIAGRDLLTGKTVTLDEYLDHMQYNAQLNNEPSTKTNDYLNKKLLIRKNPNGKSLFGKILHIEHPKKPIEDTSTHVEIQDEEKRETIVLNVETEIVDVKEEELTAVDDAVDVHNEIEAEKEATEEQMNVLSKTLNGLCDIPSLRKKLLEHRLEIKYIEKRYDVQRDEYEKDVRVVNGCLMQQDSGLIINEGKGQKNVTSLTVTVTNDRNNQTTTKVTFHEKQISCHICKRTFQTINLLNRHIQMYHTERNLTCNICQLKFNNHAHLTKHRKTNDHYFICETCDRRFTTQGSLRKHQTMHDQNVKHLECVICQARFANVSSLSKHLLMHTHIKAYQCESCGKAFTTLSDLNIHKRTHNPVKMCYCNVCGRKFSRHSNLIRHMEIHKSDGALHKCGICECSYKYMSSLTRHIVQNHMTHI